VIIGLVVPFWKNVIGFKFCYELLYQFAVASRFIKPDLVGQYASANPVIQIAATRKSMTYKILLIIFFIPEIYSP